MKRLVILLIIYFTFNIVNVNALDNLNETTEYNLNNTVVESNSSTDTGNEVNNAEAWEKIFNEEIEKEEEHNEELIHNAETLTQKNENHDSEDMEKKKALKEWEDLISGFEPAEMLTFEIGENDKEVFYFNIR
jgi:hypothetical protein